jgi:hypothetical protein
LGKLINIPRLKKISSEGNETGIVVEKCPAN